MRIEKEFGEGHVEILVPTVNVWIGNIKKVLSKLAETNPDETCLGEIYYWRDVSRLLTSLEQEL